MPHAHVIHWPANRNRLAKTLQQCAIMQLLYNMENECEGREGRGRENTIIAVNNRIEAVYNIMVQHGAVISDVPA